jgi:hydrogenase maturation protease
MGDEGIGPVIIDHLRRIPQLADCVDLMDLGTSGLAILHAIEGRQKVVIIDCAYMGLGPGQMRRFGLDEVLSTKQIAGACDHQMDVIGLLNLARTLGQLPDQVVILGIEPKAVEPGPNLSEDLTGRIGYYLEVILAELDLPIGWISKEKIWQGS